MAEVEEEAACNIVHLHSADMVSYARRRSTTFLPAISYTVTTTDGRTVDGWIVSGLLDHGRRGIYLAASVA